MMDFTLDWLRHLHEATGSEQVASRLLLYYVVQSTHEQLLASGLVPVGCLRLYHPYRVS